MPSQSDLFFYGHASFGLGSKSVWLLTDPWYSDAGAYDGAWYQLPRNHHALDTVERQRAGRTPFVYVSHEHKDHCDAETLTHLANLGYTAVIPVFDTNEKLEQIVSSIFPESMIIRLLDSQQTDLGGIQITMFIAEEGINCDSAILAKTDEFSLLNMNDCKIFDRVTNIRDSCGPVDVFTVQFSGASMHPICYKFEQKEYERISRTKRRRKFNAVYKAAAELKPRFYIPSAGPAVFFDDNTYARNFEENSVFPNSWDVAEFLRKRVTCEIVEPGIGDTLDVKTGHLTEIDSTENRINKDNYRDYIERYREDIIAAKVRTPSATLQDIAARLKQNLELKLNQIPKDDTLKEAMYFRIKEGDSSSRVFRVGCGARDVAEVAEDDVPDMDRIIMEATTDSWASLFDAHHGNWEDYCLSFRFLIDRIPDKYNTSANIFLFSSIDDLYDRWMQNRNLSNLNERITIESNGNRYEVNRFCPHAGADLCHASISDGIVVCPRHQWRFELNNGGVNPESGLSINAIPVDETEDSVGVSAAGNTAA